MEIQLETKKFKLKKVTVDILKKEEGYYGRYVHVTSKKIDEVYHIKKIDTIAERFVVLTTFKRATDQVVIDGKLDLIIGAELSKHEKIIGFVENGGIYVATVYNVKDKTNTVYLCNNKGELTKTKYLIVDNVNKQDDKVEFIGSYLENDIVIKEKVTTDSLFREITVIDEVVNSKRLTI